jgi:hypothetical protein
MILLVTYDLKGPTGSYTDLFDELKAQQSWCHYMASTWLVQTDLEADALVDKIRPYFKSGDRLLVVPLQPGYQGHFQRRLGTGSRIIGIGLTLARIQNRRYADAMPEELTLLSIRRRQEMINLF